MTEAQFAAALMEKITNGPPLIFNAQGLAQIQAAAQEILDDFAVKKKEPEMTCASTWNDCDVCDDCENEAKERGQ